MKKKVSVLLAGLLATSMILSACSKTEETTKKKKKTKKTTTTEETESEPETEPSEVTSSESSQPETTPTETTPPETTPTSDDDPFSKGTTPPDAFPDAKVLEIGAHEIPEYEYHEVNIEEQEIYNEEGLQIVVTGYKLQAGIGRSVTLRVPNTTGHKIKLKDTLLLIDGFEETGFFIQELEDQTTTDVDFEYFYYLGESIGHWDPGEFQVVFEYDYLDTDQKEEIETPVLTFQTSAYGQTEIMDLSYGAEIYNDGTYRIIAFDFYEDDGDMVLMMYIENNSGKDITVHAKDIYINGRQGKFSYLQMLGGGHKSINSFRVLKDRRKEYGIDGQINEITMKLDISNQNDYKDVIEVDPVKIHIG